MVKVLESDLKFHGNSFKTIIFHSIECPNIHDKK
jgi:hypothetical protein